jgi:hypothetical protein
MVDNTYEGRCFCGSLRYTVAGEPLFSGYCHCQDCRDWGGNPMVSFVIFPFKAFKVSAGEEHLTIAGRVPETPRGWCSRCGGHVGVFRTEIEMPHVALGAHVLADFPFTPTMHLFCDEAVLQVDDELPHYRGTPEELGGSGELISGGGAR